jgi:hypothetical protein
MTLEKGFVEVLLQPHNLNGWYHNHCEILGPSLPLFFEPELQGTIEQKRRKHNKFLGSSKADPKFTLGDDLTMAGVLVMANKTLVGKSYGRQFSEKTL